MKKIEQLWEEIESEIATTPPVGSGGGLLTRLATPEYGQRLRVGVEWPSRTRVLIFSARETALPPRASWPECRGLELLWEKGGDGQAALIVRLRDGRGRDVFTALTEDLARRAIGGSEVEAARRVLAALARWQRFLAATGRSLSDEARRGLWGELKILGDVIAPVIGIDAAVDAWRGPAGAPQDFQYQGTAVEVKTRAARSPAVVRISGEQQLHDAPWKNLFLAHVVVDEQEGSGETLPQRIASLRKSVAGGSAAELFEDGLLDAGWLEAEEDKHHTRGFFVREFEFFKVVEGFPRLTPPVLPQGIGGLAYDLSLDAAAPYGVTADAIREALESS
jgi:Putative  PD-(D/E)XK family member, (DUF4420)